MTDLLNNKELVAVGHELAKALSTDTPIIDIAKILTRLAERLDCTTAALREMTKQRDALATENAGLKKFITQECHVAHVEPETFYEEEITRYVNADGYEPETPATDAFLAEVRDGAITEYANKRGFSFQHGSIHAHFGNGDVMVGAVTFENGDAGINFAPVREKTGGVGTSYEWTKGKTADQVDSVFIIASSNAEGLEVIRDKLNESIDQLRKGVQS